MVVGGFAAYLGMCPLSLGEARPRERLYISTFVWVLAVSRHPARMFFARAIGCAVRSTGGIKGAATSKSSRVFRSSDSEICHFRLVHADYWVKGVGM